MSEQKERPAQDSREKKEIKEPFRPEDTPRPPQVMDTSKEPGQNQVEEDELAKKTEKKKKDN